MLDKRTSTPLPNGTPLWGGGLLPRIWTANNFYTVCWVLGKVHLSSALDYPSNSMEQTSYSSEERCGIMSKKEIINKIVIELLSEDLLNVNDSKSEEILIQEVTEIVEKKLQDYSLVLTSGIIN